MKREIKFRGKVRRAEVSHSSHSDWVKGNYILDSNDVAHILCTHPLRGDKLFEIDPETVGQYTGLKDKNGREIYEGDICTHKFFGEIVVVWSEEDACFACNTLDDVIKDELSYCLADIETVIGNIHNNPELLK